MLVKEKAPLRAKLFVGAFLLLLLLPYPTWWLLRGHLDTANYENRTLAALPDAQTPLSSWPAGFEAWQGDHAPFRNQWMSLNARMNRGVGTLASSDVLLGKEGWLFLKNVSDSQSLADYQGLTAYTDAELAEMADTLAALQTALQQRGIQLAVVLAPAKEGVYSQYMPDSIPVVARPTRVQALAEYLQQNTAVPVIFPQEELCRLAADTGTPQVYYKYDTHWNRYGAWVAVDAVQQALGFPATVPASVDETADLCPTDLANVSASWALCKDDVFVQPSVPCATLESNSEDGYVTVYTGDGTQRLLFVRDSFGEAMAPMLAACFSETQVVHNNALATSLPGTLPDVVVLESAERFSDNLLGQARALLAWAQALPAQ